MNTDKFNIRVVVVALAVGVLGGLAALSYLAFTSTAIPDQLDRLITFLAGGLTTVLVSTKTSTPEEPTSVQVVNQGPSEALPVTDVKEKTK